MIEQLNNSEHPMRLNLCDCKNELCVAAVKIPINRLKKLIQEVYGQYYRNRIFMRKLAKSPGQVLKGATKDEFKKIKHEWLAAKKIMAVGHKTMYRCIHALENCKAAQLALKNFSEDKIIRSWIRIRKEYDKTINKFLQMMNEKVIKAIEDWNTYCDHENMVFTKQYNLNFTFIFFENTVNKR